MPSPGEQYNPWRLFVGSIVPNVISRNTVLSPTSKLVFARLCQFAGENGQAYPSYRTLGYEVGVEERQAKRAVKELVAYGLIRLIKQYRPDGGSSTNIFEFLWHDIFIGGPQSPPGVTNDTGGSVRNVIPSRCHKRHPGVSDMTPKENHTNESESEETTTEQIRVLMSGTRFSVVSDNEVLVLIKRHGGMKLLRSADIAAETWRRDRKEIRNPVGYLQTLCESHSVPEWYQDPEVRAAKSKAVADRKYAEAQKQIKQQEMEEREAQERDRYWISLSEEDRQKYRTEARESSPLFIDLDGKPLNAIAKLIACDNRSQMSTITGSNEELAQ